MRPQHVRLVTIAVGLVMLLLVVLLYRDEFFPQEPATPKSKVVYQVYDKYPVNCVLDAELERLVHTNGTRTLMYVYYHNNNTGMAARRFAHCKDWIVPLLIPRSPYMESEVYREYFAKLRHSWTDRYDFILACTYRHTLPNEVRVLPLTPAYMKDIIAHAVNSSMDVVPLEPYPKLTILGSLLHSHGLGSVKAWNVLLMNMRYSMEEAASAAQVHAFWRSAFLIRPATLADLTGLMVKAMRLVDRDENISAVFRKDAKYGNSDPIVSYQVFGTPYYQMHPFIFERLPSFFLHILGAKMYIRPPKRLQITV